MYQIGQVVFVVLNKKHQVYPMQVVETVTKKTLKGEEIKYFLQAGSDVNSRIMLDQIDGEVFTSAQNAKSTLISRATDQISKLVALAENKAKEWYGKKEVDAIEDMTLPEPKIEFKDEPQDAELVMLPDGQMARVRLPKNIE